MVFQSKGARYYLAPKGLKVLRKAELADEKSLHVMYKNKSLSEEFVDQHIDIIRLYLAISSSYPNKLHIFTNTELIPYSEFPANTRPDLYIRSITAKANNLKEYMLYSFIGKRPYAIRKLFDAIVEHFDSGDWEEEAETAYPTLLIVCTDTRAEQSTRRYIATKLDNMGIDDLNVLTTTIRGLLNSNKANRAVWSSVLELEQTSLYS